MEIKTTSVADAIAFDPNIPSTIPADIGHHLSYDPTSGLWIDSDQNAYHRHVSIPDKFTTVLNTQIVLTNQTNATIVLEGSASGASVKMPAANTLYTGQKYEIYNTTSQVIPIYDNAGVMIANLSQNSVMNVYLKQDTTQAGIWLAYQVLISSVATGVIAYNVVSSVQFSTTSSTDTPITSYSLTPQAGTYGIWFSSDITLSTNNALGTVAISKGGSLISDTKRTIQGSSSNFRTSGATLGISQFSGSQTCEILVSVSSGTLFVNQRSLLMIRIGA